MSSSKFVTDFKTFQQKNKQKEKRLLKENVKLEQKVDEFMNGRISIELQVKYISQKTVETKNNGMCNFKTFLLKKQKKKDMQFIEKLLDKIKNKYKPCWTFNDKIYLRCLDNNRQLLLENTWYTKKFYFKKDGNTLLLVELIEKY